MDNVCLVKTVLDLTSLDLLDSLGHIHGYGSGLRVRHQALGSKYTAQTSYNAHHIRCSDYYIEIQPAFVLDLRNQLLSSNEVCACSQSLVSLCVLCEYQHACSLSCSVGKNYSAADLLICVTSVAAGADVSLDGLIEFCGSKLLYDSYCLFFIILSLFVVELCSLNILLSMFHIK